MQTVQTEALAELVQAFPLEMDVKMKLMGVLEKSPTPEAKNAIVEVLKKYGELFESTARLMENEETIEMARIEAALDQIEMDLDETKTA